MKKFILIPLFIFITGFIIFIVSVVLDVKSVSGDANIHYVSLGEQKTVDLNKGEYYIYLDEQSYQNHSRKDNSDGLTIRIDFTYDYLVTINGNQTNVDIDPLSPNIEYTLEFNGNLHYGIAKFKVDEAGEYTIDVSGEDVSNPGQLMITKFNPMDIVLLVFKNIAIIGVTVLTSLITFLIMFIKHNNKKKEVVAIS